MKYMRIDGDAVVEVSRDYPETIRVIDQPERTQEAFPAREERRADGTIFVHPAGTKIVPATYTERPATPADVGLGPDWLPHDGKAEPGWVRKGKRWVAP
jgi:hypothetical protein